MFSAEQLIELSSNLKSLMAPICRTYNLSFAQFLIISNIPRSGISLNRLALLVGSEISTMSRNIDKLETTNYVIKSAHLTDKRKILIICTEKAINLMKLIYGQIQTHISEFNFDGLNDTDLMLLKNVLEEFSWVFYKYLHEK